MSVISNPRISLVCDGLLCKWVLQVVLQRQEFADGDNVVGLRCQVLMRHWTLEMLPRNGAGAPVTSASGRLLVTASGSRFAWFASDRELRELEVASGAEVAKMVGELIAAVVLPRLE